ncbi:MAG: hypothetical protein FWF81_01455, partial [Defluviitaleaceae bacterium]|nr:hypothetical protein [Defluviitaleaceae bacterium]
LCPNPPQGDVAPLTPIIRKHKKCDSLVRIAFFWVVGIFNIKDNIGRMRWEGNYNRLYRQHVQLKRSKGIEIEQ